MSRQKRYVGPGRTPEVRLDVLEDQMERLAKALLALEEGPAIRGHQKLLHASKTIIQRAHFHRVDARRPLRAARRKNT